MSSDHMRGNQDASTGIADNVTYQMLTTRGNGVAAAGPDAGRSAHALLRRRPIPPVMSAAMCGNFAPKTITHGQGDRRGYRAQRHHVARQCADLLHALFQLSDQRRAQDRLPGSRPSATPAVGLHDQRALLPQSGAELRRHAGPAHLHRPRRLCWVASSATTSRQHGPDECRVPAERSRRQRSGQCPEHQGHRSLSDSSSTIRRTSSARGRSTPVINRASDRNYLRDFGNDLFTASIGTLTSSAYINGGGSWGGGSGGTPRFGADDYQNVDPSLPDSSVQYRRWPRGAFNVTVPIERWLEFGWPDRSGRLSQGRVGGRQSSRPVPLSRRGLPRCGLVRAPQDRLSLHRLPTDWRLQDSSATSGCSPRRHHAIHRRLPSRSLPIVSLDSGLIFDRSTSLFGTQLHADAGAAAVLPVRAVPQSGQSAAVRHEPDVVRLLAAVLAQPVFRRRPPDERQQPDRRHHHALAGRQRH